VSEGKGIEAYMLIVVEHGADEEVLHALMKLEGIAESSLVYGEYDIHCKIKVDSMDQLREVIEKIRRLKVITTETLIAYERASRRVRRISNNHLKRLGRSRARR